MGNIEFIAANNLPVTEAEEVDVLCVVDGELKRKPAEGLGGGKGYLITLTDENTITDSGTILTYIGNRDEVFKTLYDGGFVWVDATAIMGSFARMLVSLWMYDAEVDTLSLASNIGQMQFQIDCTTGTWTPPVIETSTE